MNLYARLWPLRKPATPVKYFLTAVHQVKKRISPGKTTAQKNQNGKNKAPVNQAEFSSEKSPPSNADR
jgi:hypothetical protein